MPECGTAVTGYGTQPNSPSLTPSWGALDTLWFAVTGVRNNYGVSSYPTNYIDGRLDSIVIRVATCRRELNASSENPDVFFFDNNVYWIANTVAIEPGSSYDTIVRLNSPYNSLVTNLGVGNSANWGLQLLMPTAVTNYTGEEMTGNVTLIVSEA